MKKSDKQIREFQTPELIPIDSLGMVKCRSVDQYFSDEQLSLTEKIAFSDQLKPSFKGRIEMIIGPMFAGKSTELLRRVQKHRISGKKCLFVKYAADTRYDVSCIATHDKIKEGAVAVQALSELGETWKDADVIGIDEAQFYKDAVEFVEKAAEMGKIVVLSCLVGDAHRECFSNICDLIPKAEKIKQLHAICKSCHAQASFTICHKQIGGSQELIGGEDLYTPVCRECYNYLTEEEARRVEAQVNQMELTEFKGTKDEDSEQLLSIQKSEDTLSPGETPESVQISDAAASPQVQSFNISQQSPASNSKDE